MTHYGLFIFIFLINIYSYRDWFGNETDMCICVIIKYKYTEGNYIFSRISNTSKVLANFVHWWCPMIENINFGQQERDTIRSFTDLPIIINPFIACN